MAKKDFKGKLERLEGVGTWIFVDVPFDVERAFGARGQVKVQGTVNGAPFRSSLMPRGDGTHFLVVNKSVRDAAKAKVGDAVRVALEPDAASRVVEVPPDFAKALDKSKAAKDAWDKHPPSHQKEYLGYITEAKKEETRTRRIAKTVEFLAAKRPPK
ncbi:MAG: DUF1905 domain-containing protein [Candidatus Aminicenantes bacterium]|nr:DUF1905 domain-containing protein [Candidatus Aminicenantes bacterium]